MLNLVVENDTVELLYLFPCKKGAVEGSTEKYRFCGFSFDALGHDRGVEKISRCTNLHQRIKPYNYKMASKASFGNLQVIYCKIDEEKRTIKYVTFLDTLSEKQIFERIQ